MSDLTVLETERLVLAGWGPEQVGDLIRLHGDPEITRYLSTHGAPETRQQAEARLARWADEFARHRMGKLRVTRKADGAFVGRAGFGIYPRTGEPELGYALLRENWGLGYAKEAAAGLRDWIFRETDRDQFIGFADVRNAASIHVLQSIGMRPTIIRTEPDGMACQFHVFTREDWHG
ncbi:MAG: GNAT family N-acetyltransferase [Devosia sp.]|nr:GNAT family N-acetyltransferase [Devosia sp.]